MESVIRGHHIYKSVCHPVVGEQLTLERENSNSHDRHAVSVMKDTSIITRTDVHIIHTFVRHMRLINVGETLLKLCAK